LQILNGGAPCQQIDSQEEDEQEAEAEDEVSTRDTLHALSQHMALLLLCSCSALLCCAVPRCAVPCCAVLCCAVLCCAVLCCVVTSSAHFSTEVLLCGLAVRAKLAVHHPLPFLAWQVTTVSKVSISMPQCLSYCCFF
jgi:hypothetical protein